MSEYYFDRFSFSLMAHVPPTFGFLVQLELTTMSPTGGDFGDFRSHFDHFIAGIWTSTVLRSLYRWVPSSNRPPSHFGRVWHWAKPDHDPKSGKYRRRR